MLPRNWIILGVFISMIFVGVGTLVDTWDAVYFANDTIQNYSSTYNYISNLSTITEPLEKELDPSTSKTFSLGFLDFIATGSYNVLVAILSAPKIFLGLIGDISSLYLIPDVYKNGFLILITVALVFGIIGVIFRRKT